MSAIPVTRALATVLRDGLASADDVRLIIGKGLPDDAGLPNANAYVNVEIEGQKTVVPKLANASLGAASSGHPVYILVTTGGMLAIGTVLT